MSITPEETIKILTAKAKCMRRETSGIDIDCNYRNCDECDLCYKQGTTGDQMEALRVAISALQAQDVSDINVGDMISRQKAIDTVSDRYYKYGRNAKLEELIWSIEGLPSAQPDIVRCKDCLMHGSCRFEQGLGLDGYCSQAERRIDGGHNQQTGGD